MPTATAARRAIGIVRVSESKGREGDSFASPKDQRDRIEGACRRDNLRLVDVLDEIDVSGGTALEDRAGLRQAVEAVEAGEADVIVAAYFDRLVRSLRVQDEFVSRVEAAGGGVYALDVGQITNGSAGQWRSGTMLGAVAEYQRRTAAERSREAQQRAIDRGVPPWPNVSPGYIRTAKGEPWRIDPATAPIVLEAFERRDAGATVNEVRAFVRANGIELSYHGVNAMLKNRLYIGQIHFGDYRPNLNVPGLAIVPLDLWNRVHRMSIRRGRKPKSERLLARLGVLRCGSCGSRMVVGTSNNSSYWIYRCPPNGDCQRHMTIGAEIAERVVVDEVRRTLADAEGRASVESNTREAELALERAQANLEAGIRAFTGLEDEAAVRDRLAELREVRDQAQERLDHLGGHRRVVTVNAADDWDRLSLDARRALIRATVARAVVGPGRGADRIAVELFSE